MTESGEFSLDNLQSEHERRAYTFLAELKPYIETNFPGMLRYAFDKSAEDIAHWDGLVREAEQNAVRSTDLERTVEAKHHLEEVKAIVREREIASASQTEIAIGLQFNIDEVLSVAEKDKAAAWLREKAAEHMGILNMEHVVDKDSISPVDVQLLVYKFDARDQALAES